MYYYYSFWYIYGPSKLGDKILLLDFNAVFKYR